MKSSGILLSTALAVGLMSGCAAEAPHSPMPSELVPDAPITVNTLPERLPPKVAQVALSRMAKVHIHMTAADGEESYSSGTGILLSNKHILTAGHVAISEKGTQAADCGRTFVSATTKEVNPHAVSGEEVHGSFDNIATVQGVNRLNESSTDIALLTRDTEGPEAFDEPGPLPVRRTPLRPGENLFIISFGPDDKGNIRDPNEDELAVMNVSPDHRHPRIIGAVVTRHITNDRVMGITGLHDYSVLPEPDKRNKEGDSGGAAFTTDGEFVGIVSQGAAGIDMPTLNQLTNTTFTNLPAEYKPSLTSLQPITPQILTNLPSQPHIPCA